MMYTSGLWLCYWLKYTIVVEKKFEQIFFIDFTCIFEKRKICIGEK